MSCTHIFSHLIRYPIIILMHSPHTLFTCHIPSFILLITLSRYHITPHLSSPSIISYTYRHYHTSPLSSHITHHNMYHPTSQFTHHHINTMTTPHSPAKDGRNISSESSCYIYFITCLLSCFNLSNKELHRIQIRQPISKLESIQELYRIQNRQPISKLESIQELYRIQNRQPISKLETRAIFKEHYQKLRKCTVPRTNTYLKLKLLLSLAMSLTEHTGH